MQKNKGEEAARKLADEIFERSRSRASGRAPDATEQAIAQMWRGWLWVRRWSGLFSGTALVLVASSFLLAYLRAPSFAAMLALLQPHYLTMTLKELSWAALVSLEVTTVWFVISSIKR